MTGLHVSKIVCFPDFQNLKLSQTNYIWFRRKFAKIHLPDWQFFVPKPSDNWICEALKGEIWVFAFVVCCLPCSQINLQKTKQKLCTCNGNKIKRMATLIARFMGPTWGLSGADRTQLGPMLAPWSLLTGKWFYWAFDKSTPGERGDELNEVKDEWKHQAKMSLLISH